jgi:hypothetical protein
LGLCGSGASLNPGEGFTMKGTSGTNTTAVAGVQNNLGSSYDFRGKPNDGTISIPVTSGDERVTLSLSNRLICFL